jgi:hypothetical protein
LHVLATNSPLAAEQAKPIWPASGQEGGRYVALEGGAPATQLKSPSQAPLLHGVPAAAGAHAPVFGSHWADVQL